MGKIKAALSSFSNQAKAVATSSIKIDNCPYCRDLQAQITECAVKGHVSGKAPKYGDSKLYMVKAALRETIEIQKCPNCRPMLAQIIGCSKKGHL